MNNSVYNTIDKNQNDENNEKNVNDIINERLKLIYKCKLVKELSEKIKEKKNIYELDLLLYTNFLINIENDPNFIIPELFILKFNLFNKLKINNNLNFNSFYDEYYD